MKEEVMSPSAIVGMLIGCLVGLAVGIVAGYGSFKWIFPSGENVLEAAISNALVCCALTSLITAACAGLGAALGNLYHKYKAMKKGMSPSVIVGISIGCLVGLVVGICVGYKSFVSIYPSGEGVQEVVTRNALVCCALTSLITAVGAGLGAAFGALYHRLNY